MSKNAQSTPSWLGRSIEVEVGPVAHGGFFISRHEGRVIFVRHALPGERVVVQVTEDRGGSFCRADAVHVLEADSDRVPAPCEYAKPGGCGGCDFQHVSLQRQRALKAAVIAEQLQRLAGITWLPTVQPLSTIPVDTGSDGRAGDGLGWRRRVRYALDPAGRPGLHRHRSLSVQSVQRCLIAAAGVGDEQTLTAVAELAESATLVAASLAQNAALTPTESFEVAVDDAGEQAVLAYAPQTAGATARPGSLAHAGPGERRPRRSRQQQPQSPLTAGPNRRQEARQVHGSGTKLDSELISGPVKLKYQVGDRQYSVTAGGFWQTHPGAANEFVRAVLDGIQPRPGEAILDLYAGAGLFSGALARAVGPTGSVRSLELDAVAVADAAANLADLAQVTVARGAVTAAAVRALAVRALAAPPVAAPPVHSEPAAGSSDSEAAAASSDSEPVDGVDAVVLDPPRTGAGRHVMQAILQVTSRVVVYVACDPAALARDVGYAHEFGWALTGLQAFDAFPMTHHVECVAVLTPTRLTPRILETAPIVN